MDSKALKVLGIVVTVGGAALSLLGSWVGEKQLDHKVNKAAAEAVAKALNSKEES